MKKLFIYYSLTGNGDVVADYFKDKGYEIRKVIPKHRLPKNFFLSMMVGGFKSAINKKDKLVDFDKDISNYDKIVIGSPIWFDRTCSPINTVLNELDIDNRFSFVFYSGGGEANNASKKIKNLYNIDSIILRSPKDNKKELDKLKNI